jgi:hypothetical protein
MRQKLSYVKKCNNSWIYPYRGSSQIIAQLYIASLFSVNILNPWEWLAF